MKEEKELGVCLFDRTAHPLRLTYAGELYVKAARQILTVKGRLLDDMKNIAESRSGRLSIGVTKLRSAYLLPKVLPRFMELKPNVEIELAEENASVLEAKLLSGDIEIAILLSPSMSEHFEYRHIFDEDIVLCMPPGHPLADEFSRRGPDFGLLGDEPFIMYKRGQRVRRASDIFFAKIGFKPKVLVESQLAETILGLVSAGVGSALLPKFILMYSAITPKPAFFALPDPALTYNFAFAWKKNSQPGRIADEFIQITEEVLGAMD